MPNRNIIRRSTIGNNITLSPSNLVLFPEDFGNAAWLKLNGALVTTDLVSSPQGTLRGDYQFATNPVGTFPYVRQNFTLTTNVTYRFSIYARLAERNAISIQVYVGGSFFTGNNFTLTDQWVKYVITFTPVSSSTVHFRILNGDGSPQTWIGSQGIYIWGAELIAI